MNQTKQGTASERFVEQSATVADDLRQFGHVANEAAREQIDHAREFAAGLYEQSRRKLEQGKGQVEAAVRNRPLSALAIAAGAGLLLGFFISRRR